MFGIRCSSHPPGNSYISTAVCLLWFTYPASRHADYQPANFFVRYFTNFDHPDIIFLEKSYRGRIFTIVTPDVIQSAALSVWKSWTLSHFDPLRRLVITTDGPPPQRLT